MARFIQIFGWALILLGIMLTGLMGVMVVDGPPLTEQAGSVWIKLHPFSLGQFQVLVQRILGLPDLWDNYLVPILKAPAWQPLIAISLASFLLGGILLISARSRRRAGIVHQNNHMS